MTPGTRRLNTPLSQCPIWLRHHRNQGAAFPIRLRTMFDYIAAAAPYMDRSGLSSHYRREWRRQYYLKQKAKKQNGNSQGR